MRFNLWVKLLLCALIVTLVLGGIVYLANKNLGQLQQATEKLQQTSSQQVGRQIQQITANLQGILLTGLGIMFVVAVGLALVMYKIIVVPAKKLINGARQVAAGDLTTEIEVNSSDELGELAEVFNWMINKLANLVKKIQQNSEQVKNASQQLTKLAEEVSATVEDQAKVVKQNSQVGREIDQSVGDMVEEIKAADEVINQTEKMADTGLDKANKASQDLDEIKEKTETLNEIMEELEIEAEEIGEIIDTIDQISDNTNMLALNASIEATRSGNEGGEGFTVVAEEIRDLAADVHEATTRIKELIKSFQSKVQEAVNYENKNTQLIKEGVELTATTINHFEAIGNNVLQITEEISAIRREAESQKQNLTEVVEIIEQVNQEMQSLTQITDDAAESGEILDKTVDELVAAVEEFEVK